MMSGTARRFARRIRSHLALVSLVITVLLIPVASAPFAADAAEDPSAELEWSMQIDTTARVQHLHWYSQHIPVKNGQTYRFEIAPQVADADLYLYDGADQIARSLNAGRVADVIEWTATRDATVSVWVFGFSASTDFALRVSEGRPRAAAQVASRSAVRPARIGLQIGHLRAHEQPAPLNRQTGGVWGSFTEPGINTIITEKAAQILREAGYDVEILPANLPQGYSADVVVSVHSDSSNNANARGFFADRLVGSAKGAVEDRLVKALNEEYARATGIPYVYRGTSGTKYYYGYYRVTSTTPMALIENGFITNAADREIIIGQPDRAAEGIAAGIHRFLSE